mgnify:CR=1 FL=1
MTTEENIKTILDNYSQDKCKEILSDLSYEHCYLDDEYKKHYPDEYDSAIELARLCIEKQLPKKPLPEEKYYGNGRCPNCNAVFIDKSTNYCGNCGQALEWKKAGE